MRAPGLVLMMVSALALAATAAPRGKALPTTATAAPRGKALPPGALDKLRADLRGDSDEAAVAAAKQFGESGAIAALDSLTALLAAGTTPVRAQAALDALSPWGAARSLDVLLLYTGNRNNELRVRAVKALGAFNDRRATVALLERLGDAAAPVRAAAAEVLAARKEKQAVPRLLLLVKRNDAGAAGPLGMLAPHDLIPKIAELQGAIDDGVLATALGEYIKREDVADKMRVDVVRSIGGLQGAGATTALVEYIAVVPPKDDRPSRREAQKLLDERGAPR